MNFDTFLQTYLNLADNGYNIIKNTIHKIIFNICVIILTIMVLILFSPLVIIGYLSKNYQKNKNIKKIKIND